MTVREGCGYDIQLEASCYNPAYADGQPRVFINEARWVRGAVPFQGDVGSYRQYLINHEVGHAIGYQRHEACGANGELAPVMMQQTFSTNNNDAARFDPGTVQPGRQNLPVQPLALPDRLTTSPRATVSARDTPSRRRAKAVARARRSGSYAAAFAVVRCAYREGVRFGYVDAATHLAEMRRIRCRRRCRRW